MIELERPLHEVLGERMRSTMATFGYCHQLLYAMGRANFTIASAVTWVLPALRLDQYVLLFHQHHPVGFISWAHVDDDLLDRLRADSVNFLDFAEWNEGVHLWIVDFIAMPGFAPLVARAAATKIASRIDVAHFKRDGRRPGSVRRRCPAHDHPLPLFL